MKKSMSNELDTIKQAMLIELNEYKQGKTSFKPYFSFMKEISEWLKEQAK